MELIRDVALPTLIALGLVLTSKRWRWWYLTYCALGAWFGMGLSELRAHHALPWTLLAITIALIMMGTNIIWILRQRRA